MIWPLVDVSVHRFGASQRGRSQKPKRVLAAAPNDRMCVEPITSTQDFRSRLYPLARVLARVARAVLRRSRDRIPRGESRLRATSLPLRPATRVEPRTPSLPVASLLE